MADYEAVRLAREGMSMRVIGRQMGVGREAVRAALVQAGAIEPARSI
jgi:transposase-like protein